MMPVAGISCNQSQQIMYIGTDVMMQGVGIFNYLFHQLMFIGTSAMMQDVPTFKNLLHQTIITDINDLNLNLLIDYSVVLFLEFRNEF
jgi:hypothetical protein